MSTADSSPIPADAAPADRPLVRVSHVSKFYGDFQALDDVSLDIHRGEVVAVIGASGSGKSTLCRTINRLETIQEGTIEIDGELLPEEGRELTRLRAEVGMVFQSFNLFPHRTVLDNITLAPMRVRRQPRAQAQERARELLERVGLADQAFKRPPQLSGGQAQRVAIARALAMDPKIILFDLLEYRNLAGETPIIYILPPCFDTSDNSGYEFTDASEQLRQKLLQRKKELGNYIELPKLPLSDGFFFMNTPH